MALALRPDLKPEVLERAGAALIYGASLLVRLDLQYPCRLLPWPAEARAVARFSLPRFAERRQCWSQSKLGDRSSFLF